MLPVAGGTLCLLAGRYVVWCVIEDVDDRDEIKDIVTIDNYHEFVPWADSYEETLILYGKLLENDGSGFVLCKLVVLTRHSTLTETNKTRFAAIAKAAAAATPATEQTD
jgi:hypothetical protein